MPGSRRQGRSSGEKRKEAEVNGRVLSCRSCGTCTGTELRRGDVTSHCWEDALGSPGSELPGTSSSSLVSPRGTTSLGMAESSKCPASKLLFLFLPPTEKNKQSFPHLTPEKDSQASSPGSCVIPPCVRAARRCGLLDTSGDAHTASLFVRPWQTISFRHTRELCPPPPTGSALSMLRLKITRKTPLGMTSSSDRQSREGQALIVALFGGVCCV